MPVDLDALEERQKHIRHTWRGEHPKPGTAEFGERASTRRSAILDETWKRDGIGDSNPEHAERYAYQKTKK